jgi:hypothetical protein
MIDFAQATDQKLAYLAAACQPATFGVARNNVRDESYQKAGKMGASEFVSAQFSPLSSGIMEGLRKALFGGRTNESLKVELYKLNVYGMSMILSVLLLFIFCVINAFYYHRC